MQYFKSLRVSPWEPKFRWCETIKEAANEINIHHEDYPFRNNNTEKVIINYKDSAATHLHKGVKYPTNVFLKAMHKEIFFDTTFAGNFRDLNVRVGLHRPPTFEKIQKYMQELEDSTLLTWITGRGHYPSLQNVDNLDFISDWYTDFETIHPFQDGNGRVGGCVVAIVSKIMCPEKGWLAPLQ